MIVSNLLNMLSSHLRNFFFFTRLLAISLYLFILLKLLICILKSPNYEEI